MKKRKPYKILLTKVLILHLYLSNQSSMNSGTIKVIDKFIKHGEIQENIQNVIEHVQTSVIDTQKVGKFAKKDIFEILGQVLSSFFTINNLIFGNN